MNEVWRTTTYCEHHGLQAPAETLRANFSQHGVYALWNDDGVQPLVHSIQVTARLRCGCRHSFKTSQENFAAIREAVQ